MIIVDTNALIHLLNSSTSAHRAFSNWLASAIDVNITMVTWAEFLCGPVAQDHVEQAEIIFPTPIPLLREDAASAAELFNFGGRKRGSIIDCMIAATCIRLGASLATDNLGDFKKFTTKGLKLATFA